MSHSGPEYDDFGKDGIYCFLWFLGHKNKWIFGSIFLVFRDFVRYNVFIGSTIRGNAMKTLAKYFYTHAETNKSGYVTLMSDAYGKDHVFFDANTPSYTLVANMVRFLFVNDGNEMSFDGFVLTEVDQ